jgi:hypothetical protein
MLKSFLNIAEKDTVETLFSDLKIFEKDEQGKRIYQELLDKHMSKYPVIFITLKDISGSTYEEFLLRFKSQIIDLYAGFQRCMFEGTKINDRGEPLREGNLPIISDVDYAAFKSVLQRRPDTDFTNSLKLLTRILRQRYNHKVVVLIDEYDAPLLQAYDQTYYPEAIKILRTFLSSALKSNDNLYMSVITGCTYITKNGLFSSLNSLNVSTVLDPLFSQYFGFTDEEVLESLTYHGFEKDFKKVKRQYDGYTFGADTSVILPVYGKDSPLSYPIKIYNPLSVKGYLGTRSLQSFWIGNTEDKLIRDCLSYYIYDEDSLFYKLALGEVVEVELNKFITFDNFKDSKNNVFTLLLHAGYLKVLKAKRVKVIADKTKLPKEIIIAKVQLVNNEVHWGFNNTFSILAGDLGLTVDLSNKFIVALEHFNHYEMKEVIDILIKDLPNYDYEAFYQGAIATLLRFYQSQKYIVRTEYLVPNGRIDILLTTKDKEKAYIFELKRGGKIGEGLKQIDELYKQAIIDEGYNNVIPVEIIFTNLKVSSITFGK